MFRVSAVSYSMAFKVMLIPLEESMVDVLGRLLSLVQHTVVQKYGSAVALLQLTHTHKNSNTYYCAVLFYVETKIFTYTTKVDLVLCTL